MKKLFWAGGIFLSLIIILLLGLTLFVKSYLKSDKLKSIIIPRIEELTGRKVDIDQINVSIFKGIVVKNISLKERDGKRDFIKVGEFILDYSLLPLLKREIIIKRIELVSPYVHIRRERDLRYNFSDITEKLSGGEKQPEEKELPFTIITDRISIRDARFEFTDALKDIPDISAKADAKISASPGKDFKKIIASGYIDLKELRADIGGSRTNTTGRIDVKAESINLELNTEIDKDNVKLTGTIKDYLKSPDIKADLYAKNLDLDRLMSSSGKKGAVNKESPVKESPAKRSDNPGVKAGNPKVKAHDSKPQKADKSEGIKINASGAVKVDSAKYKGYYIKDFHMSYRYKDGAMNLEPLGMRLAGGEQVNAEGTLKGDLHFRYGPESAGIVTAVKKTLSGKGGLDLNKCEIKSSKITDAIAAFTGLSDLRSPRFEKSQFTFNIREERIYLEGNMNSSHIKLDPKGNVGFDERMDIITDLKLSPVLSAKISTSKYARYLKDEAGWSVLPLKITGTVESPSVGLNPAGIGKQIERGVKEELEKRLFKGIFGK